MKFWIIDIEKEVYLDQLSKLAITIGMLGFSAMWVFILFFIIGRASIQVESSLIGLCFFGILLLIFFATLCRIHYEFKINAVLPAFDQEKLQLSPTNRIFLDQKSRKRNSARNLLNDHKITWNVVSGIFWTVFTLAAHSFIYVYAVASDVPTQYHTIFMANIAFPVTICLVFFAALATNILYNLWVDYNFGLEYLKNFQYRRLLLNIYSCLGLMFLLFAFISSLFSSFCGMVSGDTDSTVVFVVWVCLLFLFFLFKGLGRYCSAAIQQAILKNN